jgi:F-box protein, helicase, 18
MNATEEQIAIRDSRARTLLVSASAGTGKTTTAVMYAQARPNLSMTYLAFNRAIKEEAQRKFPANVRCVTTHGLAYRSHGRLYKDKLGNPRPHELGPVLGLNPVDAAITLNIVNKFLASADREIGECHTLEEPIAGGLIGPYIDLARKAWSHMADPADTAVSMPHDGYLKLFQLSSPKVETDVILFDEAQDANAVTLAIVQAQNCGKVFIGDSRQSIYGFRGAVNAMEMIEADQHLRLTTSFRYGPGVARLANAVLSAYDPMPYEIQGAGKHPTRYAVDRNRPHTVLARTNAGLFAEAVRVLDAKMPFAFVGGVENYKLDNIVDAHRLSIGRREDVRDKMIKTFRAYEDMVAYGEAVDDKEVKALARIVEEHGDAIPGLVKRISTKAVAVPRGDEVLMTTGHKAKGLEWMDVMLTDDFTNMLPGKDASGATVTPAREEVNLLYVAVTRALRGIEVHPGLREWLAKADPGLNREVQSAYWRQRNSAGHTKKHSRDVDLSPTP